MTNTEHLPDIPRLIAPLETNYAKGTGSEYRELDLKESGLKLHITHQPEGDTAIILARDGEDSASIIADPEDNLRVKTPD